MSKTKVGARKAKFRKGQVVAVTNFKAWVRIVSFSPHEYLGKIFRTYRVDGLAEPDDTLDESQLRPLTSREKGK